MNITKFFQNSGDVLQFILPTVVGLQDVASDFKEQNYQSGTEKTLKVVTLIGVQRYGCKLIKWMFPKIRPDGSDYESFPSGHFMIGMQCTVRSFYRDGPNSLTFLLTVLGTGVIGLGRYLPMKHDVVDLTAGGLLGSLLGGAWNGWIR
ncbi:MAG: hypothetical protein KDK96_06530 [Chlamydiia bacterium]|nr:hypothetical protein [Chlamydiia bacterium]